MKKSLFALLILFTCRLTFAQDIMQVIPDSASSSLFSDFLGLRLWGADYSMKSINQDLTFKYTSVNTGYVMQHDIDVRNLNHIPNVGLGVEENLDNHLLVHFLDISVGYTQNTWDWNIGTGLGYFISLDKKRRLRFRGSFNIFYESISYGLGSYSDPTNSGFIVNGNNVGAFIKNVNYVNNNFCVSAGVSLMYRTKAIDFFAGVSWTYALIYSEKINFYSTKIPLKEGIYTQSGSVVNSNILNLGNNFIQVGIIREFGL
ncbi:MAG TPA: hypothetical protein VK890_06390 [Bacteroidia bacterium]|jgi:hypothetical protein|nr:hypothetical protein [Bacteroidia bacterium]